MKNIWLNEINRTPIVIISTSRSGSTSLLNLISKKLNLILYAHPKYNNVPYNELEMLLQQSNNWVFKIHADELIRYFPKLLGVIKNSFIIRIRRRNIIEQMASHYCAYVRNKWVYNKGDTVNNADVGIDLTLIKSTIRTITIENKYVNYFPIKPELDLWYEDLDLSESDQIVSHKPKNFNEIIYQIKSFTEKKT